eukprot:GHVT01094742.1.p2 GENE.GHVT01094742.1~~GHVT01094742.1.p2  ORF type:complete len:344 (+),score=56.68 GHVT01094742.1:4373-5404(+)
MQSRMFRTLGEISRDTEIPPAFHHIIPGTNYGFVEAAVHTDIGGRKHQEDRCCVCPKLLKDRDDCGFFGVFDGTVGEFASDTVKELVIPHLVDSEGWREASKVLQQPAGSAIPASFPKDLENALKSMYIAADNELVKLCAERSNHYASSTSVTAILANGYVAIGHLGDSRVALGWQQPNGQWGAEFLTHDHKPDLPHERQRILESGGSVEYLHNHNNKPFIRGGDFSTRKGRGETPMQLQYSRAFGGKDLKKYGLSSQPDLRAFELQPHHRVLVLASDGLWDVQTAERAVGLALEAKSRGQNPAQVLVDSTLREQAERGQSSDNITVMTLFLPPRPAKATAPK